MIMMSVVCRMVNGILFDGEMREVFFVVFFKPSPKMPSQQWIHSHINVLNTVSIDQLSSDGCQVFAGCWKASLTFGLFTRWNPHIYACSDSSTFVIFFFSFLLSLPPKRHFKKRKIPWVRIWEEVYNLESLLHNFPLKFEIWNFPDGERKLWPVM